MERSPSDGYHFPVGDRRGLDFGRHIRLVCDDLVTRLPELAHIDMSRVAVCFSQARKAGPYGVYASLTPMRCEGGGRTQERRGKHYRVQQLFDANGVEYLYILSLCLPRFQDQEFIEKVATIIHELWHISPTLDGDLRRHEGRCYAHSRSQRDYDERMRELACRWLAGSPPPVIYEFLELSFSELQKKFGAVYGQKIRRPKMIRITAAMAAKLAEEDRLRAS